MKLADKRMFSKTIVDSDVFLEMPLSTQALYFHLSMRADDDGFLNNANKIRRTIGATEDDFKLLVAKSFVLVFNDGIVVIKQLRINNYLRNDRYRETVYKEENAMFEIKENGAYSLLEDGQTKKIPLEKTTKKENDMEELQKNFQIIYDSYPKKVGKARGFDLYKGWLKGRDVSGKKVKLTNKQIWGAIAKYKNQIEENGTNKQFIKQFDTFMNKAILDYVEDGE